jgi:hypothetical protein
MAAVVTGELTIVPPIIVNESSNPELPGAIHCLASAEMAYAYFEDWYAESPLCGG